MLIWDFFVALKSMGAAEFLRAAWSKKSDRFGTFESRLKTIIEQTALRRNSDDFDRCRPICCCTLTNSAADFLRTVTAGV